MSEQLIQGETDGVGKAVTKVAAMEPIWVRPSKAARLLDMSRSRVYECIQTGEIPAVKIAGSYRISVAALKALGARIED